METITSEILEYILDLENKGLIDRFCKTCQEVTIPKLKNGAKLSDIFVPSHKASNRCESGKHPHCTCDTCF